MFESIIAATDGSETASRALDAAIDLSNRYDAKLYIVHIHLHGRPAQELTRLAEIENLVPKISPVTQTGIVRGSAAIGQTFLEAEHDGRVVSKLGDLILERARDKAMEAGVKQVEIYSGSDDYADGILEAIDETGADLVVMGRRGLGLIRQMVVGSVSNKVVQHAGSAVLLIQ